MTKNKKRSHYQEMATRLVSIEKFTILDEFKYFLCFDEHGWFSLHEDQLMALDEGLGEAQDGIEERLTIWGEIAGGITWVDLENTVAKYLRYGDFISQLLDFLGKYQQTQA